MVVFLESMDTSGGVETPLLAQGEVKRGNKEERLEGTRGEKSVSSGKQANDGCDRTEWRAAAVQEPNDESSDHESR